MTHERNDLAARLPEYRKMTTEEFAHKVAWEGGIFGALDYGLTGDDIEDPSVAEIWDRLRSHYDAMTADVAAIDLIVRRSRAPARKSLLDLAHDAGLGGER